MKKAILLLLLLSACGKAKWSNDEAVQYLWVECYSYDAVVYGPALVKELRKIQWGTWEIKTLNDNWVSVWGECYSSDTPQP